MLAPGPPTLSRGGGKPVAQVAVQGGVQSRRLRSTPRTEIQLFSLGKKLPSRTTPVFFRLQHFHGTVLKKKVKSDEGDGLPSVQRSRALSRAGGRDPFHVDRLFLLHLEGVKY